MQKLVIASNNAGKITELSALLLPLQIEVISQSQFNVPEADEPHPTFIENALAKARHASTLTRLPALADDSGICINALNGDPGIHSARFAGEPKSDQRNNEKLIQLLNGMDDRSAYYYCVVVAVRHTNDPRPLIAEGVWHGEIIDAARGERGFGYDPHFYLKDLGKTAAELDASYKNSVSHRGQAMRELLKQIHTQW